MKSLHSVVSATRSFFCRQTAFPQKADKQIAARNLKVVSACFVRCFWIVVTTHLTCGVAFADANSVMNYSESKLLSVGADMAEAVSANAPRRIDNITVLLGAIFVRQTKTFIYKYDANQPIDLTTGRGFVVRQACGDPIRKAFMRRGFVFRHSYVTPSGQQNMDVRYGDC